MANNDSKPLTILLITTVTSFMASFLVSAINIALPVIGAEMKMDSITLSWVATAYLLATAVPVLISQYHASERGKVIGIFAVLCFAGIFTSLARGNLAEDRDSEG